MQDLVSSVAITYPVLSDTVGECLTDKGNLFILGELLLCTNSVLAIVAVVKKTVFRRLWM